MLSKSSKYAIRAVLYLSINSDENKKLSPTDIAEAIEIPAPFIAKILQELTKRGLISSLKGRGGGFYLNEKNKKNSLISIVDSIDGIEKFQECMLGLAVCSDLNPCPIHHTIAPLRKNIVEHLTYKTIDELATEVIKGTTHLI
ncbi:MAG: Rrf2 family transcriptional regulator [Flavobacteriaceae bacterium]|nr:Rrf2 family transcriptional regulator [Flavobacteriaceae bacterium]